MKAIGIIPSRYASTRLPGKPLLDILGKSMIQRVYEQCKKSKSLSKLIVATDDKRIHAPVLSFGGEAVMTSKAHETGTERCNEVVQNLNEHIDIIINIQGDEPNIDANLIDSLISLFDDPIVEMASVASSDLSEKDLDNPNVVKVCLDKENNARSFERTVSDKKLQYFRHIGIYAYRKEVLETFTNLEQSENEKKLKLEQLRALDNNIAIKLLISDFQHRSIDVKEDLKYYEI